MNKMNLLLVEDDDDHADLIQRILDRRPSVQQINRARDGVQALEFLRTDRGTHTNLVLMDLKLPRKGGLEVLEEVRADSRLTTLPIIILTTSSAEIDRASAYQHHANSYLVKPMDFTQFQALVDEVATYWGLWNQFPPAPAKNSLQQP